MVLRCAPFGLQQLLRLFHRRRWLPQDDLPQTQLRTRARLAGLRLQTAQRVLSRLRGLARGMDWLGDNRCRNVIKAVSTGVIRSEVQYKNATAAEELKTVQVNGLIESVDVLYRHLRACEEFMTHRLKEGPATSGQVEPVKADGNQQMKDTSHQPRPNPIWTSPSPPPGRSPHGNKYVLER